MKPTGNLLIASMSFTDSCRLRNIERLLLINFSKLYCQFNGYACGMDTCLCMVIVKYNRSSVRAWDSPDKKTDRYLELPISLLFTIDYYCSILFVSVHGY